MHGIKKKRARTTLRRARGSVSALGGQNLVDEISQSKAKEIEAHQMGRPHLVILGAGASLAAFPNGDCKGKRLPLMRTFVKTLGLTKLLRNAGIPEPYEDFEAIYSDIATDPKLAGLRSEIENSVNSYFSCLQIPNEPTLYDHLVLSLRSKDVIATFNWDPFLCQAAQRNAKFGGVPRLLFLHGNTAFRYCKRCKTGYPMQTECPECGGKLENSPLLYPVKQKNYQSDPAIAGHWRMFEQVLKQAWVLTIFGYGAPKTDIEAIRIMKTAWGDIHRRNLEQVELIDLRTEEDLTRTWSPFIHTHHYTIHTSFYDSCIARFPRRSGEALWAQLMECKFLRSHKFPRYASFSELYAWLQSWIEDENEGRTMS